MYHFQAKKQNKYLNSFIFKGILLASYSQKDALFQWVQSNPQQELISHCYDILIQIQQFRSKAKRFALPSNSSAPLISDAKYLGKIQRANHYEGSLLRLNALLHFFQYKYADVSPFASEESFGYSSS